MRIENFLELYVYGTDPRTEIELIDARTSESYFSGTVAEWLEYDDPPADGLWFDGIAAVGDILFIYVSH